MARLFHNVVEKWILEKDLGFSLYLLLPGTLEQTNLNTFSKIITWNSLRISGFSGVGNLREVSLQCHPKWCSEANPSANASSSFIMVFHRYTRVVHSSGFHHVFFPSHYMLKAFQHDNRAKHPQHFAKEQKIVLLRKRVGIMF